MSRIFWDTNLFIYLFEEYGPLSRKTKALLERMDERNDELFTSTLTIGEVLTRPMQKGDIVRCEHYENAIRSNANVIAFDGVAARSFAKLRALQSRKLPPPDAIQLACAATAKVDLFLTNDTRLHNLHVDGIHFITSVDRAPI